jgi:8-oxo-dGTP diphosphatase
METPKAMSVLQVVAYAVVQNKQLLMVRKRNTSKFMFPGGKLAHQESELEAVIREVREEINCEVDLPTVRFLGKFTTMAANEANTQLEASVYSGQLLGTPTACNEIEELYWLPLDTTVHTIALAPLVSECVIPLLASHFEHHV